MTDAQAREQLIARAHRLGVVTNAGLAALKLSVGAVAGSRALLADGVHSLSDVLMNAGAWIGWRYASRPPDRDHHYGHGNAEALTALLVGLTIVAAGGGLIWTALRGQSTVTADLLGLAAVLTELVTIAVKLGLWRVTDRRGRELDSAILIAIARDNAGDMLTSALIMIAIIGAIFGLHWLEPAAAIAIGLLIGWQGLRSIYEGIGVLMDRAPDHELTAKIARVASHVEGVISVDRLRVHPLGTHLRADMEISVDGRIAVTEGHAIAHAVSDAVIAQCRRVEEVAVHVNPS
ncbi:MAG TPA: cation diffusion facilitator family transporter [Enhygromyxa sp.]|nr:cation diffusion facilitator family transporter [Enhygromyxa sp.]